MDPNMNAGQSAQPNSPAAMQPQSPNPMAGSPPAAMQPQSPNPMAGSPPAAMTPPTPQVPRNIDAEKQALDTFTKAYGKMPTTQGQIRVLYSLAYPTLKSLPDEYKTSPSMVASYAKSAQDLIKEMNK